MRLFFVALALVSGPAFAKPVVQSSMIGDYSAKSAVRFFNYDAATCAAEEGQMVDDACIEPAKNTVAITRVADGKVVVDVSVVFGPANQREFTGVVVKAHGNKIVAVEAPIDQDANEQTIVGKPAKDACKMTITQQDDGSLKLKASSNCDTNLLRADGAAKD